MGYGALEDGHGPGQCVGGWEGAGRATLGGCVASLDALALVDIRILERGLPVARREGLKSTKSIEVRQIMVDMRSRTAALLLRYPSRGATQGPALLSGLVLQHSHGCPRCRLPRRRVFYILFFPHPIYYLRPTFPCSSLVVTRIPGHSRLFSPPPLPLRYAPCFYIARGLSTFFPRRLASNSASPRY